MKQQFHARSIWGVVNRAFPPEVVALAAFGFLSFAVASAKDWEIALSRGTDAAKVDDSFKQIGLRANVENRVYVFVKNPTNADQTVSIRLSQLSGTKGKETLLQPPNTIENVRVALPKEWQRVSLAPPMDPKQGDPKAKDGKAAVAPVPMILLPRSFTLLIEVLDKDGKQLAVKPFPVHLLQPNEVVKVTAVEFKTDNNTLSVAMHAVDFTEPAPVVELVLLPQKIEGLLTGKKEGVYLQKLKANETTQLVARNLKFMDNTAPENGIIYLTVDGYQRAFALKTTMSNDSGPAPNFDATAAVRILPAEIKSKPVEKLKFRLEVDNPPLTPSLKVELNRVSDKIYELQEELLSGRQQLVSLSTADPGGALVFKTKVEDWELALDAKGVFGKKSVRVQLLDNNDKVDDKDKLKATGEAALVFDDTPPEGVKFLVPNKDNPKYLERGKPLLVQATGNDPESGISRAVFFVGKPVVNKDGIQELPPNVETVQGEMQVTPLLQSATWTALLPLPSDKKGVLHISVQFVNGADQSTFQTIPIELIEPGAGGGAGGKRFKIEGKVLQGAILQPNLEVMLKDEKGAVKATTRTGKDGKERGAFTFNNVPPGVYTVSSSSSASKSRGQTAVTVETSNVANVEIKLLR
jgi:hypothetical protein